MLGKKIPLAKKAAAKPPAKSPSVAAGKKRAEPEEDEPEEERHGASEILAELGSGDGGNDDADGLTGLDEVEEATADPGVKAALKLFLAKSKRQKADPGAKGAQRFLKTGSGPPTVTIEGLVLRCKDVMVKGRKAGQQVPKKECTIEVLKVNGNNAEDLISSGVPGLDWLLPTYKPKAEGDGRDAADDAPEGGGGGGSKEKRAMEGPPRQLSFGDANHKTIWLGHMPRVSFYTQAPGDKGESKEGMDQVVVGMLVQVNGVVASLSDSGDQLWLNAAAINPLKEGIVPGTHVKQIMEVLSRADVTAAHAFRLSQAMRGFYGWASHKAECEMQAKVFRDLWTKARDGAVGACEARAMAIRGEHGNEKEGLAAVLEQHAARLRVENPADLAYGKPFFNPALPPTADRPAWTAGIVMKPISCEFVQHQMLWNLFASDEERNALPETFCAGVVNACELQGACLNVSVQLNFVGSRTMAALAVKEGKCPVVNSGDGPAAGALGIKLNMRELPATTGLLVQAKAEAFCKDLVTYGDWFAVAGVTPREPFASGVTCVFPSGYGFDMRPTLMKMTAAVSEEWVKTHLALGEGQFAYEKDSDVVHLKGPDKKTDLQVPLPAIKSHYYQEVTGSTWKFSNARMPADAPKKLYRVWYEGVCDALADEPNLCTDTTEGEQLIAEISSQMSNIAGQEKPLTAFLHQYAALYALAMPNEAA